MTTRFPIAVFLIASPLAHLNYATTVSTDELCEARRWTAARFQGRTVEAPPTAGLAVLANHNEVCKNTRLGKPLTVAGQEYASGLYTHAPSKLQVRLPGPARSFTCLVGVDSNPQTRPGQGSVIFTVRVGQKEVFRSKVMKEGMPAEPVKVDLDGAIAFDLEVGDAGDGIGCDQADWVNARVLLADGRTVAVGDLPFVEGQKERSYDDAPPFSFVYDGKPSAELLKTWTHQRSSRRLDDRRTEWTLSWSDPRTRLALRCVGVEYHDFPTVEWTLYFKNTGTTDSPILADIQALDICLNRLPDAVYNRFNTPGEFLLHHSVGSPCTPQDFKPLETPLPPKTEKRIAAARGRATSEDMSYFNVEWPGEGLIIAIGWPGQWAAQFNRNDSTGLTIRSGVEKTHFKLLPGEEVRSPLVALQFWKGTWTRSQNIWRRWMIAHNQPRPNGKPLAPFITADSSAQFGEMIGANEENQIFFINRYLEEQLKIDYWWMDAGWYVNTSGWPNTGTWEVDTKRFPRGLRAITDHAHTKGLQIIVWFEPERVTSGTWLTGNHPEWILGGTLLNLGDPNALKWLTNHVDKLIVDQGIDLYRQDFNMDPLEFWRKNDAPDRQGITEIQHITGYLAYWDELQRRHPSLLIDTCASGGRRLDLETLRRSVPLWRTDYPFDPIATQSQSYGLALWVPFSGTGVKVISDYDFRSNAACTEFTCHWDMRVKDLNYEMCRRHIAEWRRYAPNYLGDYYPLTAYSLDTRDWMAWQFDRPEAGEGMVQVFRRENSIFEMARLRLYGLQADAQYSVTDLDNPQPKQMSGQELISNGLPVTVSRRPGAVVVVYKRITPDTGS